MAVTTEVVHIMEKQEEKKERTYKVPVLFLRKSKAGKHLYAFNRVDEEGKDVLGGDVGSILINISEIEDILEGKADWVKVSVLPAEKDEDVAKDTEAEGNKRKRQRTYL